MSASIFHIKDNIFGDQWRLKEKQTIHGMALIDDHGCIKIIGNTDFIANQVRFSINPKADDPIRSEWEKKYLEEQEQYHNENVLHLPMLPVQRERGVPDCYLVKDGLDIFIEPNELEKLYQSVVFGGAHELKFSIKFWKLYCHNDFESQKINFDFLQCPSEDGDVTNPQMSEGRLAYLALTKNCY
jgi:hypothetical protein